MFGRIINIWHVDLNGYRRFTGAMNAPPPACRRLAPSLAGARGGALMAAGSMSCVQLGLALSVHLFGQLGPLGVAGLRLAWAGLLLVILVRPRLRHFTRRDLLACCLLGAVTAGLTLLFLLAIARIPLGTASALEFLGPLAVSLFGPGGGHRRWVAPAAIGVLLLTHPWHSGTDPAGLAFALAAAVCWAAYILLTQHVGDHVTGLTGLAVSMPVAGTIALLAAAPSLSRVTWPLLGIMLGLAVLHPVVPFSLEFLALRRLTASAFGTLMSLEPAIALLAGLLVLHQIPGASSAAGIVLVAVAGIGATRTGGRAPVPEDPPRQPVPPVPLPSGNHLEPQAGAAAHARATAHVHATSRQR
jgi:inner membrane transporter RhtA